MKRKLHKVWTIVAAFFFGYSFGSGVVYAIQDNTLWTAISFACAAWWLWLWLDALGKEGKEVK